MKHIKLFEAHSALNEAENWAQQAIEAAFSEDNWSYLINQVTKDGPEEGMKSLKYLGQVVRAANDRASRDRYNNLLNIFFDTFPELTDDKNPKTIELKAKMLSINRKDSIASLKATIKETEDNHRYAINKMKEELARLEKEES